MPIWRMSFVSRIPKGIHTHTHTHTYIQHHTHTHKHTHTTQTPTRHTNTNTNTHPHATHTHTTFTHTYTHIHTHTHNQDTKSNTERILHNINSKDISMVITCSQSFIPQFLCSIYIKLVEQFAQLLITSRQKSLPAAVQNLGTYLPI